MLSSDQAYINISLDDALKVEFLEEKFVCLIFFLVLTYFAVLTKLALAKLLRTGTMNCLS